MLHLHYALGFIVVLTALVAIFNAQARRLVLYLLVLQIVVGAVTWWMLKVPPPPAHWILPILAGGVYAMASAFERRGRPASVVMGVCVLGALIIAYTFYLGMHAVAG